MAKVLICPDVHGRKFWHKAKELINEVDQVVFLGDYLDPYGYEDITFDMAIEEFQQILEFKEKYWDKVILLIGNHDAHYISTDFMDCSRLNYSKRQELHELYTKHINKFSLVFKYEDTWLFSHAGVYKDWLNRNNLKLDDLLDFKTFLTNHFQELEDLSFYRGGYNTTGSCVWADIRESLQYEVLPCYNHIVGHTQLNEKPYITDNITCLDVKKCFILDTLTGDICDV